MDTLRNNKTSQNFKIENTTPKDAKAIKSMVRDCRLELYPSEKYGITHKDIEATDWSLPKGMKRRVGELFGYITGKTRIWVLKNEKRKIVGFCEATKLDAATGEVNAIYISKEFRGKGLGKKLMERAIEWLGPNRDIKLKVVIYNFNAREFYKKFGFKETEKKVDCKDPKLPGGKEIPRIGMTKEREG